MSSRAFWLYTLLAKLLVASALPLSSDESYYWVWGQNPQLSYFDHPPMVAWLFHLGESWSLLGLKSRWPFVLLGHLTAWIWFLIIENLNPHKIKDESLSRKWFALALFNPLLGPGSLLGTPDVPLLFFWSLSLFAFLKLLERPQKTLGYLFLGVALGLGFLSKYHIVLFVPLLFFFLFSSQLWKKISWSSVPLTLVAGLILCLPVLIWNYQNDWSSFRFQLQHGFTNEHYQFLWTADYVLGQILIVSPFLLPALCRGFFSNPLSLLSVFGLGPVLFFLWSSFHGHVEANWPIIAMPALLILALKSEKKSWPRLGTLIFWGSIYTLLTLLALKNPPYYLHDKLREPFRYQSLAPLFDKYPNIYASKYQMAASLWYLRKSPVYKLKDMSRYDFFDTFEGSLPKGPEFYLIIEEGDVVPAWVAQYGYMKATQIPLPENFSLLHYSRAAKN